MTYLNPVHCRQDYLALLLLADESEAIISEYINEGEMYTINEQEQPIGICLFIFPQHDVVEIKNIAILPDYQRRGIGKKAIAEAHSMFQRRGFSEIIVGTANSSLENILFYQKCGFRMQSIRKGFFINYPAPIYENGIQALDMIVFQKNLIEGDE
ncbi:N-acetyltransferase [Halobacillus sp. A5]|uniref:GNAT family N-acetyltransferase n=1 Tax=Halobacillus sp. A5 TaxID=2880263 RepID=UPI0020A63986|nr:GNAT family N-acetyltransferase [Halobacillus sp. A5]MCP3027340.1 GNAT family N-acetyltransferase [Halobacillus sp. A5]